MGFLQVVSNGLPVQQPAQWHAVPHCLITFFLYIQILLGDKVTVEFNPYDLKDIALTLGMQCTQNQILSW